MILGIMQPYFFPYLGYLNLIKRSDRWIVFDEVQYIHKGWMNRNRILHPSKDWQYINAPIRDRHRGILIKDVLVNNQIDWRGKIVRQLSHYRAAPFYSDVISLVEECLSAEESLSRLNTHILDRICNYIGIPFNYEYFSEMNLQIGEIHGPGDWALEISKSLSADEYINPPGGEHLFDADAFREANIKLTIADQPLMEYACGKFNFIPGLSVVDVLMWNSREKINEHLL
jgi:hypothetical protein